MGFFNSSPSSLARCPPSLMVAGGSYFGLRRPKSRRQWRQDGGLFDCPSQNPEAALSDTKSCPQLASPECAEKKSFLPRDDGLCRGVRKQRGLERRHTPKSPTNALKDMAEKEVVGSGTGVVREASRGTGPWNWAPRVRRRFLRWTRPCARSAGEGGDLGVSVLNASHKL